MEFSVGEYVGFHATPTMIEVARVVGALDEAGKKVTPEEGYLYEVATLTVESEYHGCTANVLVDQITTVILPGWASDQVEERMEATL